MVQSAFRGYRSRKSLSTVRAHLKTFREGRLQESRQRQKQTEESLRWKALEEAARLREKQQSEEQRHALLRRKNNKSSDNKLNLLSVNERPGPPVFDPQEIFLRLARTSTIVGRRARKSVAADVDAETPRMSIHAQRALQRVFKVLDNDNSGVLDVHELREFGDMLHGRRESQRRHEALMRAIDVDKSGTIDFQEFTTFMAILLSDAFHRLDTDSSGFLTPDELVVVAKLFEGYWTGTKMANFETAVMNDKDREIDCQEFMDFVVIECLKELDRHQFKKGMADLLRSQMDRRNDDGTGGGRLDIKRAGAKKKMSKKEIVVKLMIAAGPGFKKRYKLTQSVPYLLRTIMNIEVLRMMDDFEASASAARSALLNVIYYPLVEDKNRPDIFVVQCAMRIQALFRGWCTRRWYQLKLDEYQSWLADDQRHRASYDSLMLKVDKVRQAALKAEKHLQRSIDSKDDILYYISAVKAALRGDRPSFLKILQEGDSTKTSDGTIGDNTSLVAQVIKARHDAEAVFLKYLAFWRVSQLARAWTQWMTAIGRPQYARVPTSFRAWKDVVWRRDRLEHVEGDDTDGGGGGGGGKKTNIDQNHLDSEWEELEDVAASSVASALGITNDDREPMPSSMILSIETIGHPKHTFGGAHFPFVCSLLDLVNNKALFKAFYDMEIAVRDGRRLDLLVTNAVAASGDLLLSHLVEQCVGSETVRKVVFKLFVNLGITGQFSDFLSEQLECTDSEISEFILYLIQRTVPVFQVREKLYYTQWYSVDTPPVEGHPTPMKIVFSVSDAHKMGAKLALSPPATPKTSFESTTLSSSGGRRSPSPVTIHKSPRPLSPRSKVNVKPTTGRPSSGGGIRTSTGGVSGSTSTPSRPVSVGGSRGTPSTPARTPTSTDNSGRASIGGGGGGGSRPSSASGKRTPKPVPRKGNDPK